MGILLWSRFLRIVVLNTSITKVLTGSEKEKTPAIVRYLLSLHCSINLDGSCRVLFHQPSTRTFVLVR